jgi:Uncharacterized conserved protein|nr:DUF1491 family protein [Chelativorans petroleitrophicus]
MTQVRVTSELWVSALIKRVFSDGGFAAVRRRGAREAGAVFVLCRTRLGELDLYVPAPQTSYEEARPDERQFVRTLEKVEEAAVEERLAREMQFDPDMWVVEIEAPQEAVHYLPLASE